jgi:DeoR/GlpR family transcriptional regulator of sugar metabolism
MIMRVFLSHSSRQKPLVREIRGFFPEHVNTWIDEKNLFIGDDINQALQVEVKEKSDFLLLFLDGDAASSEWVKKEVHWALEVEKANNRTMLLVVLIEPQALNDLGIPELKKRRYLKCTDYSERAIEYVANSIVADLFALTCRELESFHNPTTTEQINFVKTADEFLEEMAKRCLSVLFPYRRENPITIEDLLQLVMSSDNENVAGVTFSEMLSDLFSRDMLPGVAFDGYELYIQEEHYSWKAHINTDRKARVARVAARQVRSGDRIVIDAGSATDELVKVLCARFVSRTLTNVTILSNSMSAVESLLDVADLHGMDEHTCPFRLHIVGGHVRPNTRAIVNIDEGDSGAFAHAIRRFSGIDIGFLGVNGIDHAGGLTTHDKGEFNNKRDIIALARRSVVLGDSSKIGIVEDLRFGTFSEEVTVVLDQSPISQKLYDIVSDTGGIAQVVLA